MHFARRQRRSASGSASRDRQGPWREIVGVVRDSKYGSARRSRAGGRVPAGRAESRNGHDALRPRVGAAGVARRQPPARDPGDRAQLARPEHPDDDRHDRHVSLCGAHGRVAARSVRRPRACCSPRSASTACSRSRSPAARARWASAWRSAPRRATCSCWSSATACCSSAWESSSASAGGVASARSLSSFLYVVPTSDLPTFAAMTAILTAVALVACIIPARRAMRVPPTTALRCE